MRASPAEEAPDLRLVLPAVSAWMVAWQVRVLPPGVVVGAALLLGLAAAVVLLRWRSTTWGLVLAASLVCAAASAAATAARVEVRSAGPLPGLASRAAAVAVTAVVTDDPRLAVAQGGREPLVVVRVRVVLLESGGRATALRAPLLVLTGEQDWLGLLPSQRVRVEGRLRSAERGDDVAAVLSARGAPDVLSGPSRVQRVAGHLRAGLREAVAPLPDAERGLLPGLVVGDTGRLPPEVREDFRVVGLTHLT